jgi:hypothetical protein
MFERVRSLWCEQRGVWCAVDFEAWDMEHTVITEFGWSAVHWVDGKPVENMGHLIVAEHRGFTNHYVPENRRVSLSHFIIYPKLLMPLPVLSLRPI